MLNIECFTIQRKCHSHVISKILQDQRNHIFYKIKSSGCNGYYMGKTERCLIIRINEHSTKEIKLMFKPLSECELLKDCCWLYSLLSLLWSKLAFLEAYNIKNHDPIINHWIKSSKIFLLFNYILNFHWFWLWTANKCFHDNTSTFRFVYTVVK